LLHIYCCRRVWQALEIFPKNRKLIIGKLVITAIILLGVSYFANVFFASILPFTASRFIALFGGTWIFIFLYSLLFLAVIDLVRVPNKYLNFLPKPIFLNYPKTKLITMLTVISMISILCFIGLFSFTNPKITELDITIDKKNTQQISENTNNKKTLNIVAVSDLHLGYVINRPRLKQYVDLINAQNPDIVFLIGDIIDISLEPVVAMRMDEELRRIRPKYGVYFVAGNHEHIRGDYENMMNFFRSCGFIVLEDSTVLIDDEFYVVGRRDRFEKKRKKTIELTENLDKTKPIIVLDHQPFNLEHSVEAGVDLHLSGHTHNGQFFPINLIVKQIYELPYGYKKKDNTHFYVTSGLGIWGPPIRIATKSELVKIKMRY
jgi:predicted MPP superfamily phosphohydrolase